MKFYGKLNLKKLNYNKGFTLLEMLIVVAVIAILAAMALPRFLDATNKAKSAAEKANIRNIDTQIELYQVNTGTYPKFPDMDDMFISASYFPDGFPKDPFTSSAGIGIYSLDMNSFTGTPLINSSLRMRTNTFMHFCPNNQICAEFTPAGHTGFVP